MSNVGVRRIVIAAAFGLSVLAVPAHDSLADLYLTGAIVSQADPSTGANVGEPSELDNMNTANNDLLIDGLTGTTFTLTPGANAFTVSGHNPLVFTGLGLFFSLTNTLESQFAKSPDLNVYLTTSGGFAFPASGVQVATVGQLSGNKPYSGATSFTAGSDTVTVTSWNGTALTLNVTPAAVPEVGSIVAMGLAAVLVGSIWCVERRRSAKRRQVIA